MCTYILQIAFNLTVSAAIILTIVAIALPGWETKEWKDTVNSAIKTDQKDMSASYSSGFFSVNCGKDVNSQSSKPCTTDHKEMLPYERGTLALLILAVLIGLACLVWSMLTCCLCCCLCCIQKLLMWPLLILTAAAAISNFAAVTVYAVESRGDDNWKAALKEGADKNLGFCIYVAGAAAGLFLVSSVLSCLMIKTKEISVAI